MEDYKILITNLSRLGIIIKFVKLIFKLYNDASSDFEIYSIKI